MFANIAYPPSNLPTHLITYPHTYLPTHTPTYLPTHTPTYISTPHPHTHLPIYPPTYLHLAWEEEGKMVELFVGRFHWCSIMKKKKRRRIEARKHQKRKKLFSHQPRFLHSHFPWLTVFGLTWRVPFQSEVKFVSVCARVQCSLYSIPLSMWLCIVCSKAKVICYFKHDSR